LARAEEVRVFITDFDFDRYFGLCEIDARSFRKQRSPELHLDIMRPKRLLPNAVRAHGEAAAAHTLGEDLGAALHDRLELRGHDCIDQRVGADAEHAGQHGQGGGCAGAHVNSTPALAHLVGHAGRRECVHQVVPEALHEAVARAARFQRQLGSQPNQY
jgi:hypothetical protein